MHTQENARMISQVSSVNILNCIKTTYIRFLARIHNCTHITKPKEIHRSPLHSLPHALTSIHAYVNQLCRCNVYFYVPYVNLSRHHLNYMYKASGYEF